MTDGLIYVLPEKLQIMVNNTNMILNEEQKNRLLYIPYLTTQIQEKLAAFFWNELVKDQKRMKQQSAYEMDDIELARRFAEFLTSITNPLDVLKDQNYFAKVNTPGNVVVAVDIHVPPKRTKNILIAEKLSPIGESRNRTSTMKSQVTESDKIKNLKISTRKPVNELDFARKTKINVPSDDIQVIEEHKSVHNEVKNTCEKKNDPKRKSRSLKNVFRCLFPCVFRRRSSNLEKCNM